MSYQQDREDDKYAARHLIDGDREADRIEREWLAELIVKKQRSARIGYLVAYLLIVGISIAGFQILQHNRDEQTRQFCESGDRSRAAIRGVVNAVADLGVGLVKGPPPATPNPERRQTIPQPLTEDQKDALVQFELFRKKQTAGLVPAPICVEYKKEVGR